MDTPVQHTYTNCIKHYVETKGTTAYITVDVCMSLQLLLPQLLYGHARCVQYQNHSSTTVNNLFKHLPRD